jgi:pimeloyl-ACP methyl ester carboxylesterase
MVRMGTVLVLALALAGCSTGGDFTEGAVDIGGGRTIHAVCAGEGSPTVVLVPGSRESSQVWQVVAPASGDLSPAALERSDAAVMPTIARDTRVCSYDRPGVPLLDGTLSTSTLVTQPTTAQQGADDLQAWLTAAEVPGPYVLAAHSWGGLIAVRFAQEHPDEVAGLVLVDPSSAQLRDELTPAQWQSTLDLVDSLVDGSDVEVPDYAGTVDVVASGPALPRVPAVVLTSDQPFDFGAQGAPWSAWLAAHERLAESLGARHVTDTDSGHLIMIEQPALVVDEIRGVIDQVRSS